MIELDNLKTDIYTYISMVVDCNKEKKFEDSTSEYESLLAGAFGFRASYFARGDRDENIQKVIPTITAVINWLRNTDFYIAPASTRYHDSFKGGLLAHSLKAYHKMTELCGIYTFSGVNLGSATLCILTHDWCKIDRYESYLKSTPDANGNWVKGPAYKCKEGALGLGHGPQSLMMLSRFCTSPLTSLSFDEMAAIRWHMYTYDVTSYDVNDLNNCGSKIPLVLLIQFADQMAVCEN